MYRRSFVMRSFDKNTIPANAVLLSWVAGLSLGVFADRFYGEAYRACLLLTPHQNPGFFGMICINLVPLLISAYAVSCFPSVIAAVCLFRGILTGLAISAAAALYGSAAVWMGGFLFFSLLLYGAVLLWYWLYGASGPNSRRKLCLCLVLGILVFCLDRQGISPLLREIMNL